MRTLALVRTEQPLGVKSQGAALCLRRSDGMITDPSMRVTGRSYRRRYNPGAGKTAPGL